MKSPSKPAKAKSAKTSAAKAAKPAAKSAPAKAAAPAKVAAAPKAVSNSKAAIIEGLTKLLADTYTLAFKTHGYHWNVTGDKFHDLHLLFETQYTELYAAADEVAERIRALGAPVPASYEMFAKAAKVQALGDAPKQMKMVENLRDAHLTAAKTCYALAEVADDQGDIGSADLATVRVRDHEKAAWMLTSILG